MKLSYSLLLFMSSLVVFQSYTSSSIEKELDQFHVQSYQLSTEVRSKILHTPDRSKLVMYMHHIFDHLNQNEKELFVEMINQMIHVPDSDQDPMHALVSRIEKLIEVLRKKDGFIEKLMSSSKKMLSSFQRNLSGEVQLSEVFTAILHGDRDALIDLQNLDFSVLQKMSLAKKEKIMQVLQELVKNMLDQISKDVSDQVTRFHNADLDDDAYDARVRELGLQHVAYTLATIKYCKDVVRALHPLCADSQVVLLTMNNVQINPIINIIELKDFVLDPKASLQEQDEKILEQVAKLQGKSLLFVPKHKETQDLFYKQLREQLVLYYGKLYAQRIVQEVKVMSAVTSSTQSAFDTVLASHNHFNDLAPDLKQVVSQDFYKELESLKML